MIHRTLSSGLALVLTLGLIACGPGEPADDMEETPDTVGAPATPPATGQPPAGAAAMPSWFRVNGNQVEIDVVAGASPDGNYWNFNGGRNGAMTITVPSWVIVCRISFSGSTVRLTVTFG